ncbi:hypothetical protein CA13_40730 [Planctomycetes bacterium CA13]|uniref:Uncharacterized protein n=1 Tax=Novipirellula herctigrandis TaxID=2527986 RepID=A0A5C5Z605_9BACT|nr:hypothetical protein CA13_40730 [Planctomycetes bacterium CA13]
MPSESGCMRTFRWQALQAIRSVWGCATKSSSFFFIHAVNAWLKVVQAPFAAINQDQQVDGNDFDAAIAALQADAATMGRSNRKL